MAKSYHPAGIWNGIFESYDTALKHYNSVKPIRGSSPELRPIGRNRRYKYCEIRKGDNCIEAVLYETPVVRIFKDGRIQLTTGNWLTPSTANFMDAVLPVKFGIVSLDRRRMILSQREFINQDWNRYEIPSGDEGLTLQANEDWSTAMPVNAPVHFEYVANRKVLSQIRQRFKPFLDYLKVTTSMSCVFTSDEIIEHFPEVASRFVAEFMERKKYGYPFHAHSAWLMRSAVTSVVPPLVNRYANPQTRPEIINEVLSMAASDDPMLWRKLTLRLLLRSGFVDCTEHFNGSARHDLLKTFVGADYHFTPLLSWMDSPQNLQETFTEVLKIAYADICFTHKEVKQGIIPNKNNKFYIDTHAQLKDNLTSRQYVHI